VRAIAFLHIPNSPYAGAALGYRRLVGACAARGDSLDILTPEDFPRLAGLDPRWLPFVLPFVVALSLWRRRREVDVALFHSYTGWVFNFWKRGVPTVTLFHGLEPLFYDELAAETRAQGRRLTRRFRATYGWLMPRLLRLSCRRSNRVICGNRAEERYLLAERWTTPDRLLFITFGVRADAFVDDRVYAPRARRLLMVSQWLDTKGTRYLTEAFIALVRNGADLELWCAGTRRPDADVLSMFPPDIRPRVHNRADVASDALLTLYSEADIFVHPSLSEGCSNAQLEAMAAALPMVVTDTAPAADVLKDGEGGLFVPKRDPAGLAAAIGRLIDDPALRARLGRRAQQVARGLTTASSQPQLLAVLDQLTGRAAKPQA
jgi:glycosyltransferase involved in cell wall biosynthesis